MVSNLIGKLNHMLLKELIRYVLKFHNFFYGLAGYLSQRLESERLHPKHRLMDYHRWFMEQVHPEWSVLDVGCGNGALAVDLEKYCRRVVGIDISSANIKEAKQRAKSEFVCADVITFKFNEKFDAVILSNVLEHIEERRSFIERLKKCSNRFLIRVPLLDRDWITLYKKEMGVEYRLDPMHFVEYTFDNFVKEMNDAGLKIESSRIRYGEIYAVALTY